MGKNNSNAASDHGKIRIMAFELEGTNATLQQGLRSIVQAFGVSDARAISIPSPRASQVQLEAATNGESDQSDALYAESDLAVPSDSNTAGNASKPKRIRQPKYLHDLDLKSQTPTLTDYCGALQNADSMFKKYQAVAYWFKRYGELEEITLDHMYTAFKLARWAGPADYRKPFSNQINDKFVNGSARGLYKLTDAGVNEALKMTDHEK